MKYVFAVLLLAGLALAEPDSTPEAEADPAADAWYGYYGRGYGYGGYGLGHRGYYGGYGGYYGGLRGYGGYGGYGYYGRKKRSAEADPAVLAVTHSAPAVAPLVHPYGLGLGYGLGYGLGLHHAPTVGYTVEHKAVEHIPGAVTAVAGEPTIVYAGYGGYGGYGYYGRKKREADPAVLAVKHSAPTAVIPPPIPYGLGENFLAPAAPHLHTVEHKATEVIPGAVAAGATPVAYAAPYGYGHGIGYGYGYGLHHPLLAAPVAAEAAVTDARKKREADPEAEAEADPAVLYSGYYGHPHRYGYGLGGYYGGYGGYAGRGYYGYGYGRGYGGYAYYG